MATAQATLDRLIKPAWRDSGAYVSISRETALEIIDAVAASFEFDDVEFEWDAMRGLLDYYSDVRDGGDGTVILIAETNRGLSRERSGDKSGGSVLGTALRARMQDPRRTKPARFVLLQENGTRNSVGRAHKFWWPVLAAPGTVEPCVFANKVAA